MKSTIALTLVLMASSGLLAAEKPLKVFILAGQSNMEGHAKIETFDYIGDDPATAPLLKQMRGADGQPRVCDNVWISYFTGSGNKNGEGLGKLTAGYGSRNNPAEDGGKIGPEFTFGLTMDAALDEPVLIIKTAWGEKVCTPTIVRRVPARMCSTTINASCTTARKVMAFPKTWTSGWPRRSETPGTTTG